MIHKIIHQVLTEKITDIQNNLSLLDDLFTNNFELTATELAAIKTYFTSKGFSVVNGYPKTDAKFPLVAIILQSEREVTNFLGESGGQIIDDTDPYYNADVLSSVWEHVYNLAIYTEHPDITAYYYELVKYILFANLAVFNDYGCHNYHFAGMDLAPDPNYLIENLFARQFIFTCHREFQEIDAASLASKAFQIAGVHLEPDDENAEVGDVKTLITTYSEGD